MRRIVLLAIACLLLTGLSLSGCGPAANPGVTFPDPNLEAAIREALTNPSGPIYAAELAGLTRLQASSKGIENLSGLQYCTNLTSLSLGSNEISDISPLGDLINLTDLNLESNQISDISPLANLTNLTYLYLWSNEISDISPLANLTDLTHLYLVSNEISDISPLANLTDLTYLCLGSNQISDVRPLVQNEGLGTGDTVDLWENPLSSDSINTFIPQLRARGVTVNY